MTVSSTADLVTSALSRGIGLAALNVTTLEHAEAVASGAEEASASAVLQISENALRYHGRLAPLAAACHAVAEQSRMPLSLHLDHIRDLSLLEQAADLGFSSVMFDGSTLPYDRNVQLTRDAAEWAHSHGIWLEAELGEIGGKDGAHAAGSRTKPAEAARFVEDTRVDALAVAVGSSHAMTSRTARLDHALIRELRATLPVPLVLHGSSGVSTTELQDAVANGMTKINIGTLLNVNFTAALRDVLRSDPDVVDPRVYLEPARAHLSRTVAACLVALAGRAPSDRPR